MLFPGTTAVSRAVYRHRAGGWLHRYQSPGGVEPDLVLDFKVQVYGVSGIRQANPLPGARLGQHPADGGAPGLVIEPQRSNLVSRSVARATWSAVGPVTLTELAGNAFGTFPGLQIEAAGAGWHRAGPGPVSLAAGQAYALTLWYGASPAGQGKLTLYNTSTVPATNLEIQGPPGSMAALLQNNGQISGVTNTDMGGGLYRLQCQFTVDDTIDGDWGFGPGTAASGDTVTVYGLQIEDAAPATGFILADGSAATRAADVQDLPAAGWGAAGQGSLIVEGTAFGTEDTVLAAVADDSGNRLLVLRPAAGGIILRRIEGGVTTDLGAGVPAARGERIRCAIGWDGTGTAISVGGSSAAAGAAALMGPPGELRFHDADHGAVHGPALIDSLTHFPVRLPDADLPALSG